MGWSLGGILAGAGKGMADWAGREIVAEKQAERDAEQFARQKELAVFQDELAAGRAERTAELTKRYADKAEMEKKESSASAFEALNWSATSDPDGPKLKPGSPEYYRYMGDKLDESGMPDMAKQMHANANTFEDNAIKREQVAASRAATSESRAARADAKMSEAERRELERVDRGFASVLGKYQVKDEDSGKMVPDPTAYTAATSLRDRKYNFLIDQNPKMDRAEAYRKATEYTVDVVSSISDPEFKTLGSTGEKIQAAAQKLYNKSQSKSVAPGTTPASAPAGIINRAQWEPDALPGVLDLAKGGDLDAKAQLLEWNSNPSGLSAQQRALVTNAVKRLPTNK